MSTEEEPQIRHSGMGAIVANTGGGTQTNYNNSGAGNQYNADKQVFMRDQVEILAITMDPLAAAGLAGNIITLVDYSTKVVSRARQLYESASGATAENEELESLTKNLRDLADRTQRKPSESPPKGQSRSKFTGEAVLDNLSKQCVQVADELLDILGAVNVKEDGRTRKSAIQALKTVWKQDKVVSLQRRLDRISKQLIEGMTMDQLEEINRRLREMAVENTRLEANRSQEIDQLRRDFNSAIEEIKANTDDEQVPGAWLLLSDTARRGQAYFAEQVILQSLRFSAIETRHQSISKEHSHTFLWIFDETARTKYVDWLKGEEGVYWVSGKPGSGKSTLMKFVAEHGQTRQYLETWAGNKKLVTANFYFWSASTHRSQKSQRGLLRTILYQILRQCPELIKVAYHDQWIALTSDGKVLKESRDELLTVPCLLDTLRKISLVTVSDTKFCFFVDGLDEFDGRPTDIIEVVDILKSFPNIKTCVSSRPWNEFEERFGNNSPWKLYMQNFTRNDIRLYVEDTLGDNSRFQQLQKEDPQCPNFVWNIVWHADGVFLWVFLVIRSLLDGLTNSDRIKDLQERVNETPKDLRDYFRTILFSTENRYRPQTARLFAVAVNAQSELPLMAYWVIDQENPKYAIQCPAATPAEEIIQSRLENMRRRLKVLSKGLLEADTWDVRPPSRSIDHLLHGSEVGFLHRTVKDYLRTPEAQSMLQAWSDETFNVDWEIFNSLSALAKMTSREFVGPNGRIWEHVLDYFLVYVRRLDHDPLFRADVGSTLDHIQIALAPAFEENKARIYEWCRAESNEVQYLKTGAKALEPDLVTMSACVGFGVTNFVTEKFTKEPQLCIRVTKYVPSLYWAVLYSELEEEVPGSSLPECSRTAMLELLLANGVTPISCPDEWRSVLEKIASDDDIDPLRSFEAIKLLLRHGADYEQQCTYKKDTGEMVEARACELLRKWFDADQYGILEEVVRRRARKPKKSHIWSKKVHQVTKLWMDSKR